jgi:hypothetical protein
MLKALTGSSGYARVVRHAPAGDGAPDVIDEFVFLDAVGGPLGFELELLALLLGLRDGDEVAGDAARVYGAVGDAVLVEIEVAFRLVVGRVEDRVFDDNFRHREKMAYTALSFNGLSGSKQDRRSESRHIGASDSPRAKAYVIAAMMARSRRLATDPSMPVNLKTAVDCQGGRRVYDRSRFPSAACFTQWVSRLETARGKRTGDKIAGVTRNTTASCNFSPGSLISIE